MVEATVSRPPAKYLKASITMSETKRENSMKDLMAYFASPSETEGVKELFPNSERPVKPQEFREFWGALNDEEKVYFKTVDLAPKDDSVVLAA